ncbi:MAG: DUF2188 domain-containing protein [Pseudomonas sp.]
MNVYHINKTERGWELRKQGATRPSKVAATQEALLQLADAFLESRKATVKIHRQDGYEQEELSYPRSNDGEEPSD